MERNRLQREIDGMRERVSGFARDPRELSASAVGGQVGDMEAEIADAETAPSARWRRAEGERHASGRAASHDEDDPMPAFDRRRGSHPADIEDESDRTRPRRIDLTK